MKDVETPELLSRPAVLVTKMESILKEIGPKLADFGLMRQEAELIHNELHQRGALDVEQKSET